MRVHYFQHIPFETLGDIESWLIQNNHTLTGTHFFKSNYKIPDIDELDVLIIMGGPMSVYDEKIYPWLKEEKNFIRNCIDAGKKVLGICLGAQLIATCLGAEVKRAANKEIGWFELKLISSVAKETKFSNNYSVNWLEGLFSNSPVVFHWHGESFDIPHGTINILFTAANQNQAFQFGENIIALQFHLEMTENSIQSLIENCEDELEVSNFVQSKETIQQNFRFISPMNKIMEYILDHLIGAN